MRAVCGVDLVIITRHVIISLGPSSIGKISLLLHLAYRIFSSFSFILISTIFVASQSNSVHAPSFCWQLQVVSLPIRIMWKLSSHRCPKTKDRPRPFNFDPWPVNGAGKKKKKGKKNLKTYVSFEDSNHYKTWPELLYIPPRRKYV